MIPLLVAVFVAAAILLWPAATQKRLRTLLDGGSAQKKTGTVARSVAGPGHARTKAAEDEALAFDLDLVAICLTAGLPVPAALSLSAEATGDRSGLERIARSLRIGGEDEANDARLLPVLEVFEFASRTGVGPAPLIESVARELRAAARRRRQEAAAALGVKLVVPLGLCILPAFLLLSVVPVVISLLDDLGGLFG